MSTTTKTAAEDTDESTLPNINDAEFVDHEPEFATKRAIIDACQVPDRYVQATGQKGPVLINASVVRSVLLCIASWDKPETNHFGSIRDIMHATRLCRSTVGRALKVLKLAGMVTKQYRGSGQPARWFIEWDRLPLPAGKP
jgi:hypothetical protein